MSLTRAFDIALWLAGIGHFCILGASLQIPFRFHWKDELAKLSRFNRKLMWVYSGFTLYVIITFGTLTLRFHSEFLRGEPIALGLALFIGGFWFIRLILDFAYYKNADWPKGVSFVVGHILLDSLFVALTVTYLGLVIWHLDFL